MITTTAALYQSQGYLLYAQYALVTGEVEATSERIAAEARLLRVEVTRFFLFYSALWSVKLSILTFLSKNFQRASVKPLAESLVVVRYRIRGLHMDRLHRNHPV